MVRSTLFAALAVLVAVACSDSSNNDGGEGAEVRGGSIDSPEAAQQFFEAVMPQLIAVFTDVANQLAGSFPSETTKQNGDVVSTSCPEGGSVEINLMTGVTNVANCGAEGVVLNGNLFVFVSPPFEDTFTGDTFYNASFSGPLEVSGAYQGMINIDSGFADWTDPLREDSTFWNVSASIGGELVYLSSEGSTTFPDDPIESVATRFGGTCNFDEGNGPCDTQCLDICQGEEIAQISLCGIDNVCECN